MKLGFIGLGKMGLPMTKRLLQAGHEVVVFDVNEDAILEAKSAGAVSASSIQDMVNLLGPKPIVWCMVPHQVVSDQIDQLADILPSGAICIDGGNSRYLDSQARGRQLLEKDIAFVDIGTSGGILGATQGYAMMIGGTDDAVAVIWPLVEALSPKGGALHVGPVGSGHYTKMVHNAIEYGMMQSYAEGFALLKQGPYQHIDAAAVSAMWQHGSIIESLLNKLAGEALAENPQLEGVDGIVAASGEADWAVQAGQHYSVPMPSIEASLEVRRQSQAGQVSYATKLLAVLRNKFGGHQVNK